MTQAVCGHAQLHRLQQMQQMIKTTTKLQLPKDYYYETEREARNEARILSMLNHFDVAKSEKKIIASCGRDVYALL